MRRRRRRRCHVRRIGGAVECEGEGVIIPLRQQWPRDGASHPFHLCLTPLIPPTDTFTPPFSPTASRRLHHPHFRRPRRPPRATRHTPRRPRHHTVCQLLRPRPRPSSGGRLRLGLHPAGATIEWRGGVRVRNEGIEGRKRRGNGERKS